MDPERSDVYAALREENERLRQRVEELERSLAEWEARGGGPGKPAADISYEEIFDSLPVPIMVHWPDGRVATANARQLDLLGVSREVLFRSDASIYGDQRPIAQGFIAAFEKAAAGELTKMDPTHYSTSGADFERIEERDYWTESLFKPVFNEGKIRYVVAMHLDVTERIRAEEASRESTALFEAILDNSPLLIYAKDLEGHYILANRRVQDFLHRGSAQIKGLTALDLCPKELADRFAKRDRDVILTGNSCEEEIHSDEYDQYHLVNTFPIRDAAGKIYAIGGVSVDVTEHRRAEEENKRLQEEMIRMQEATLRALSTPLVPIARGVVAVPLIGNMDRRRAQQVLETLLHGIVAHRAAIAILDVTGVSVVDTEVADALIQAAKAVKLLGAQVVLTGIQPATAQTLVQLGTDLEGIVTLGTLENGIAYGLRYAGRPTLS